MTKSIFTQPENARIVCTIFTATAVLFGGCSKSSRPEQGAAALTTNASKTAPRTNESPKARVDGIPGPSPLDQSIAALSVDAVERKPQIDLLVERMSPAERLKALDQLWSEQLTGVRRELANELLRKWAQEMPQSAAEWLASKPPGPLQREASRSVAIVWANQNVNDAAAWVRQWPGNEKDSGLLAVAYEAARNSPKDALWLASELTASSSRDALITHAVREWASQDAQAPIAWADKMDPSILRDQVFANAAVSLSEKDPTAAANLALEKIPPGPQQDDTVVSIVQRWAQTQPGEAADWVLKFPEGRVRDAAVENLVQLWADKDSGQAAEWLNGLDNGSIRDTALAAYAHKLGAGTPEEAVSWAAKISDAETRERAIESVAQLWLAADRKAATAWIQGANVSGTLRDRLLSAP